MSAAPSPPSQDRPRRMGWVQIPPGARPDAHPYDFVYCPHGHHVPRHRVATVVESGLVTCDYKAPPGHGPPCGAQLLVLSVLRRVKGADGQLVPKVYVAEVDWREMAYMEAQHLDVFEMMAFLGGRYDPPHPAAATRGSAHRH